MVWHEVVLPGTQTVTVVYSVLTLLLFGPASTMTETTFEGFVGAGVGTTLAPPPPPPQETNARLDRPISPAATIWATFRISVSRPRKFRAARLAVGRRGLKMRACARSTASRT